MQRPAAPAGLAKTCSAAPRHRAGDDHQQRSISACEEGLLHQQAWSLLRALRRHDIVLEVITYNAAIRVRKGQLHRQVSSLTSGAVPCQRAGDGCLRQQAWHLLRMM